eukprot:10269598-Prorocentrum_lima.AAC.1
MTNNETTKTTTAKTPRPLPPRPHTTHKGTPPTATREALNHHNYQHDTPGSGVGLSQEPDRA